MEIEGNDLHMQLTIEREREEDIKWEGEREQGENNGVKNS